MVSSKGKIVLGITGGIAAYKSAELVRLYVKAGFEVKVIMTSSACEFITPLTLETLSQNEVSIKMFPEKKFYTTHHIDLADWAELFVVAPATANFIGKAANGIADDLLTTVFSAATCPVLIAPAMNSNMWDNPAVTENCAKLKSYGFHFIGPDEGDLACGWEGRGRMAQPDEILKKSLALFSIEGKLRGKSVLVTAGPTEEPIDSVRYISNRSSGKMGYALAIEAKAEGADVTLISGPCKLPAPRGIELIKVKTSEQMASAVKEYFKSCDVLIMAAAVADYAPTNPHDSKLKKSEESLKLDLNPTEDILKAVSKMKGKQVVVGFALETDNTVENARKKIEDKKLDLIILNDANEPGAGFDVDTNRIDIIYPDGNFEKFPLMTKRDLAVEIIKKIIPLIKQ
ncbi:MAG: bifunctional phosphopantothenoylcysteine decarboxylase/phosphopantothenate--cysteine ligase CoaBC [candidate division Zixibacteria bacterium]|nr:bifunctional phosphopantothenoylcysteine decarboxylase/phosphopantothenate--cysteine ligase CoaBC [candidate division Zixibacteria bacterium]